MIRSATIKDIKAIHALLNHFGSVGAMLSRPLSGLYDHVRDFTVYTDEQNAVVGCCALQFCWEDVAEIRSLAVQEQHWKKGIGQALIEEAIAQARTFEIRELFTLTYRPDFFRHYGFHVIDRADLPLKIWKDCIHCVKFPNCDEIAMRRDLTQS